MSKILLVDDDPFNRVGVRQYLELEGFDVMEAGDESTAWLIAQEHHPDVCIVDISIPPHSTPMVKPEPQFGLNLARKIKTASPRTGVILFSAYREYRSDFLNLLHSGYSGIAYKIKGCQSEALLEAIHIVSAGNVVIDADVTFKASLRKEFLEKMSLEERNAVEHILSNIRLLTQREYEIASKIAGSFSTEGIAQDLHLTTKTVENYKGKIYQKLDIDQVVKELAHLVRQSILAKAFFIDSLNTPKPEGNE